MILSIKIIRLFYLAYKFTEVRGENYCEIVFALKNLAKTDRVRFPKISPPEYSSFLPAPGKLIRRINLRNGSSMENILFH